MAGLQDIANQLMCESHMLVNHITKQYTIKYFNQSDARRSDVYIECASDILIPLVSLLYYIKVYYKLILEILYRI